MQASAKFRDYPLRAGMYESFYLRAVSPDEPVGVWIRHTIHKAPGRRARGSVWCTVFDARLGEPFAHRESSQELRVPPQGWIAIGPDSCMGPAEARGHCGDATWELSYDAAAPELAHLSPGWLYRAPLPRTKLTSPAPLAVFNGTLTIAGRQPIELRSWRGMVGHNWGSEHAARWIWLHAVDLAEQTDAWLDLALGRVIVAGRMTPWLASGAVHANGRTVRVGGLTARGVHVRESAAGCSAELAGRGGLSVTVRAAVPEHGAVGWRYADPAGGEHDVLNCSVAAMEIDLSGAGAPCALHTAHGGAYELGTLAGEAGLPTGAFPAG